MPNILARVQQQPPRVIIISLFPAVGEFKRSSSPLECDAYEEEEEEKEEKEEEERRRKKKGR